MDVWWGALSAEGEKLDRCSKVIIGFPVSTPSALVKRGGPAPPLSPCRINTKSKHHTPSEFHGHPSTVEVGEALGRSGPTRRTSVTIVLATRNRCSTAPGPPGRPVPPGRGSDSLPLREGACC